jgi:predicted transcriptional regulator
MARPSSKHPTELELEILKILWKHHPATVGEVRDIMMKQGKELAYTSVMTMMTIMTQKGYLGRTKQGGGYVYTPKISQEATVGNMLRDIVDRVFEGSTSAVLTNLLTTGDLDSEELKQLRKLINQKIQEDQQ